MSAPPALFLNATSRKPPLPYFLQAKTVALKSSVHLTAGVAVECDDEKDFLSEEERRLGRIYSLTSRNIINYITTAMVGIGGPLLYHHRGFDPHRLTPSCLFG